jgi:Response regulator containing a CheY-like receiver domain and a GGDEF domain
VKDTILLIEDSSIQARIIAQMFCTLTPFSVLVANSRAQAEDILVQQKEELFVVVADLNLSDAPDGEAVDACLAQGLPCIVLAASFDEKLRAKFLEKRVADYFLKGSVDDLTPLVDAVCRLHANHNVTALVVDDSSTQRGVVKRMLGVQCITCLEAPNGVVALKMLQENPGIRLVITDFNMPQMDGIELVHRIRATYHINQLAVIGLSSTGSGPLTAKFLKYGANDFLTKPFEAEEFYWRVNQTLNILEVMEELKQLRGRG